MATQLGIYNQALRFLGETRLLALTDDREARYELDAIWADSLVNYCLEQGLWFFAMRASQFNSDPTVVPPYGLLKAYEQPTDWIRTAAVCSDPFYNVPITAFADEAGFWFADIDPIYVRYISSDAKYGQNIGEWPETFNKFVAAHAAWLLAPRLTTARDKVDDILKTRRLMLDDARSKAAMNESAAFPPTGTWVRARFGQANGYLDRGNRGQLIG